MSNVKNTVKSHLVDSLQKTNSAPDVMQNAQKAIFPKIDQIFRLLPDGAPKHAVKNIGKAATLYLQNLVEGVSEADPKFQEDYISVSRTQFENSLKEAGVEETSINDLALQSVEFGMSKLGIVPLSLRNNQAPLLSNAVGHEDAGEVGEAQSDNSGEISSKKMSELMKPIVGSLFESMKKGEGDFVTEIISLFESLSGEQGKVDPEKLDIVQKELLEIMGDYNSEKLSGFLDGLDPAMKYELKAYMKNVVAPMIYGGDGVKLAQEVPQEVQPHLRQTLHLWKLNLPDRETAPSKDEVSVIKQKREYLATEIIRISKEAKSLQGRNQNYNVQAHLNREIPKLQEKVREQYGADVAIYKDDIHFMAQHLENVKNVSQKKQGLDIQAFIKDYGHYAVGVIPFVLGPIASVLSHIPIIGRSIAGLVPMINNLAQTAAPAILTFVAAKSMGGGQSTEVASPSTEAASHAA
jgi:hypothetical protein